MSCSRPVANLFRMRSSLVLQGLWKAIEEKFSDDSSESEKLDLKERALGAIFMSVTDNVLREIAGSIPATPAIADPATIQKRLLKTPLPFFG